MTAPQPTTAQQTNSARLGYGSDLLEPLSRAVVGRTREIEVVVAALMAGRHLLLEGPPGTGKSTLLRAIAQASGHGFQFVEGNAELTPARLTGHFDPAQVLQSGYDPKIWIDGPLATALRDGELLYLEEINRIPEETLNLLVTVMSEGELTIPRLGRIEAHTDFRLVSAMNPFDSVGTARISGAIYDRVCRVSMDYQSAVDEEGIVQANVPAASQDSTDRDFSDRVVQLVRATRDHPEIRVGSSIRGAVDLLLIAQQLSSIRNLPSNSRDVALDAALTSLSGRVRLHDSSSETPEQVITALYDKIMEPAAEQFDEPEPEQSNDLPPDDPGKA